MFNLITSYVCVKSEDVLNSQIYFSKEFYVKCIYVDYSCIALAHINSLKVKR